MQPLFITTGRIRGHRACKRCIAARSICRKGHVGRQCESAVREERTMTLDSLKVIHRCTFLPNSLHGTASPPLRPVL
jgi:hypothetical protein